MNIAVKLAKDCGSEAPSWASADYPVECREIGDAVDYTAEPGPWLIMSVDDYDAYKAQRIGQYIAWRDANPLVPNA